MKERLLVLHIDDEVEILSLVAEILEHPQLEIVGALDGPSGLALAAERQPDLILLDIMLPDMNGYQVYDLLHNSPETAGIPVVMLTARSRTHEKIRAQFIEGLEGYVGKPFNVQELRDKIKQTLGITY